MIPYSRQFISKKDKSYVLKALSSDFLTTGPLVKKFEEKLKVITLAYTQLKNTYRKRINGSPKHTTRY